MSKRIAICSSGSSPSSLVDGRFGRCKCFMLWDPQTGQYEALPNTGPEAEHGAGTGAVQALAKNNVAMVVSQRVGPNAYGALKEAKMKVFAIADGKTVEEARQSYEAGKLKEIVSPTS